MLPGGTTTPPEQTNRRLFLRRGCTNVAVSLVQNLGVWFPSSGTPHFTVYLHAMVPNMVLLCKEKILLWKIDHHKPQACPKSSRGIAAQRLTHLKERRQQAFAEERLPMVHVPKASFCCETG